MRNIFLLLLFFSIAALGQNKDNKWAITLGSGSVLYTEADAAELREVSALKGYRYSLLFPRVSVARYMFKNVTFVASYASAFEDTQEYSSIDGEVRYDFGTSENTISPYVMIGGSVVKTLIHLPTLNFGAGGTLWISNNFGLHGQIVYKFNEDRFVSQRSHLFGAAGLVYRFSFSGLNNGKKYKRKGRSSSRKRIWDTP